MLALFGFNNLSIRNKLALAMGGFVIFVSLTFSVLAYEISCRQVETILLEYVGRDANQLAHSVENQLDEVAQGIVVISQSVVFESNSMGGARQYLKEVVSANKYFDEAYLAGPSHKIQTTSLAKARPLPGIERFAKTIDGKWRQRKPRQGDVLISAIRKDQSGSHVLIATPTTDDSNAGVLGTLILRINAATFTHLLESSISQNLHSQGTHIANSQIYDREGQFIDEHSTKASKTELSNINQLLRQTLDKNNLSVLADTSILRFETEDSGSIVLVRALTSGSKQMLSQWYIVDYFSKNIISKLVRENLTDFYVLTFLVTGLSLLLIGVVSRKLTGRIYNTSMVSQTISRGDYGQRVNDNSQDEIGELARSVDRMADSIVERINSLKEINNQLDDRVAERSQQLESAQDELIKKGKLATLGQLTATVSHEIRNPLGAMKAAAYFLTRKVNSDDEKVKSALERINRNIDRCDHIIDDMLDFTRVQDLNLRNESLQSVLLAALEQVQWPEEIELHFDMPDSPIIAPVDPDRLARVFINLINNARDALFVDGSSEISRQNGRVNVTLKQDSAGAIVTIEDNGKGIEEEILGSIFEPLFSTKGFGTGLGLSVVQQIVRQHQGSIEVSSTPGQGTVFTIQLPFSENPPQD